MLEDNSNLEDFVGNLGLNVSGFCNGDYAKSMPVTRDEWNKVIEWEKKNSEHGSLSYWIHVE